MEQRVFDVVRLWPRGREGGGRSRLEELQFEFTKTFRGETKPLLKRGPVSPFHSPLFSLSLSLFIFSSLSFFFFFSCSRCFPSSKRAERKSPLERAAFSREAITRSHV